MDLGTQGEIFLMRLDWFVSVTEKESVYYAVRAESLTRIHVKV
jgi:hypothetical protein